jgi:hypothetical protein
VRGNEIADVLARGGSAPKFVGPELALGVSRQNIIRRLDVGWLASIGHGGKVLVILKDRLEN